MDKGLILKDLKYIFANKAESEYGFKYELEHDKNPEISVKYNSILIGNVKDSYNPFSLDSRIISIAFKIMKDKKRHIKPLNILVVDIKNCNNNDRLTIEWLLSEGWQLNGFYVSKEIEGVFVSFPYDNRIGEYVTGNDGYYLYQLYSKAEFMEVVNKFVIKMKKLS